MSFPRYPNYKDSGVEWINDVPEHWDVKPLRRIVLETNAGEVIDKSHWGGSAELLYTCAINPLDSDYEGFPDRKRTTPNDLLVTRNGTPYVHKPVENAIYTNVVQRIKLAPDEDRDFIATALQNSADNLKGYGVSIESLNYDLWKALPLAIPPLPEQTAIAAFLDRETAKIDGLVLEQRRLMELLKEKRQAVISHAVTKGLNPDAPMKPSGIEWLGDVPEHWEFGNLKRYWGVTDCKHITAEFLDEGIPLASIREVQSRWVELEYAKRTTEHFYELLIEGGRQPLPGDLIFSRNATVGEVAQVPEEHPRFAMGQDVVLLRKLSPEYSSDFLQHVIRSPIIIHQLAHMMIGSTFKRINVEEIRSFVIPSPPGDEQKEIADYLEDETNKLDTLTAEAQRAIDLLQERRTALISAAVTGQIDVSQLANQ